MMKLENLYPERVFHYFEKLTEIPHGSRNTKQISDYLVSFAKEHDLKYYQDELNNVIIVKEATEGYENSDAIIIQGHMDMVCEKENDCDIDFMKDSLDIFVDGDFVKAKGTTLGGDDGIAVAYALAILESKEIAHPKLEVIITVDEEIGMLGAADIDLSMITGHKMLNIDSEEEGHFLTGCAGGMSLHSNIPVQRTTQKGQKLNLKITGLEGGHSGAEIDKERGNANVIMGRVLKGVFDRTPFGIISLVGGLKDNAIPRECVSDILVPAENVGAVKEYVKEMDGILKNEFMSSDPAVAAVLTDEGEAEEQILDFGSVNRVVFYLRTVPNGIQNMSQVMHGMVETSLNLGIMELLEDHLHTVSSVRSSVGTRKTELCDRVDTVVEMVGGETKIEGAYPAWEYRKDSDLRMQIAKVYEELYHTEPVFETIHAGLECGLLSQKIKNLDCVAFGPDIFDIHTPKERLSISSTARVWDMLVAFLKEAK